MPYIICVEWSDILAVRLRKRMQQGEEMTGQLGWTGDNGDPDNFLFFFFGNKPAKDVPNYNTWDNAQVRSLLLQGQQSVDDGARDQIYKQVASIVRATSSTTFPASLDVLVLATNPTKAKAANPLLHIVCSPGLADNGIPEKYSARSCQRSTA